MKKLLVFSVSLSFAFLMSITSCQKTDDLTDDTNDNTEIVYDTTQTIPTKSSTEIMTTAAFAYVDVAGIVINKGDAEDDNSKSCPLVTYEPTVGYPKTLTVNFGETCTYNGHTYSGSIIASVSDRIRNEGTTISVTFNNFKLDTISLSGTMTITIDSSKVLTDHLAYFTISVSDGSVAIPSGTYGMDMDLSVKWDLGTLTDYTDDVLYFHKGTFNSIDSDYNKYSITITQQLVYAVSCGNISEGKIEIQSPKFDNGATVDFGDGTCDNTATVYTVAVITVGTQTYTQEVSYELTLP